MDWGMQNRLNRIIQADTGHTVMLAVDHGYFLGPLTRLEEPGKTIAPLLPYADALMLTRGVLRQCVDAGANPTVVLRVSGGVSIARDYLSDEGIATSVKEAVRLNASAIALSLFVGTEHERQTLLALGELVNEAEEYGLPVLAVTAVGREMEKRDARYLGLCCRMAAELGARLVKTYYCDDFEKVARGCPVPLVVAGGPKLETERDALELTYESIQRGAIGVDMGRNIWQSDHPIAMIRAIRAVVHEGATVDQAHELFRELSGARELAGAR